MTKKRALLWLIPTILLLLLIPFIVPSALTYAGAEALDLPEYNPVELTNPNPGAQLPLPDARGADLEHYSANPDGYVYDEATEAAWEYRDGTLYVKIENRMIGNTKVFFTWVQIADPTQLRTHVSQETSPIREAKKVNPVLAISGDWYSGRSEGIIYRNGVLMRAPKPFGNYDALIIDDQGDFHILYRPAADAFTPYEGHILHSFLFGPALVIDGELQVFDKNNYGSGAGMGLPNKTQRQAICQMDKLSYLIITTEGPKDTNAKDGGFTAFTTTFENLYGLDQLPGLACQRLMEEGYGFGAEGDWKTAAFLRTAKVMAAGLPGGVSFMEDYTYHFEPNRQRVLGAHMLEVCPSIAAGKPSLEVHPLGIGGKADPARLVFTTKPGPAINATVIDLGDHFRLIVNELEIVKPDKKLSKLPVASTVWIPKPNLHEGARRWIEAGGAHHSVNAPSLTTEYMEDFARMAGIEIVEIK